MEENISKAIASYSVAFFIIVAISLFFTLYEKNSEAINTVNISISKRGSVYQTNGSETEGSKVLGAVIAGCIKNGLETDILIDSTIVHKSTDISIFDFDIIDTDAMYSVEYSFNDSGEVIFTKYKKLGGDWWLSETLSKIIALVISILLLFIFPVENMLTRQDDITRTVVLNETAEFVDSVRNLGYITPLMYMQFTHALSTTGNIYEISMEHIHYRIDPIYIDKDDMTSFQHNYNVNNRVTYTDEIINRLFPENPDQDRYYYLSKGDIFKVKVVNINKTPATKVQQMLLMSDLPVKRIVVNYGGMVRDENYWYSHSVCCNNFAFCAAFENKNRQSAKYRVPEYFAE